MFTKKRVLAAYNKCYNELFRKLDDEGEKKYGERYTETHKWRIINDILLLPKISSSDTVLEIGPSITSVIIKKLTNATVETLCIDEMNRNFLDYYSIPLHICDITREKPNLKLNSYDLILFCEVFEHFTIAPHFALKTILSLVKPKKTIFFSVPNFASIQKRIQLLRGENPQDLLAEKTSYFAHLREPVYKETREWWEEEGAVITSFGFTNYNEKEPKGFFSKNFWTLRFLKIGNWYGLAHIWFPKTREYFYLFIKNSID